jgi:hypothetical protein
LDDMVVHQDQAVLRRRRHGTSRAFWKYDFRFGCKRVQMFTYPLLNFEHLHTRMLSSPSRSLTCSIKILTFPFPFALQRDPDH